MVAAGDPAGSPLALGALLLSAAGVVTLAGYAVVRNHKHLIRRLGRRRRGAARRRLRREQRRSNGLG
jgi:hypothetical protein